MRIALAQINPTVGDLTGNARKMIDFSTKARLAGADLVVFPEMCLVGYPPMDLLERDSFISAVEDGITWMLPRLPENMGVLFGSPVRNTSGVGKRLYNTALLAENGAIVGSAVKMLLPTYDVFDEYRHFEPARSCAPLSWRGVRFGVHICEDMWNNESAAPYHGYASSPVDTLADSGIDFFVNISASPFALGKRYERENIIQGYCRTYNRPFVYVNQVGANTDLLFDGSSGVYAADGTLECAASPFEEDLVIWDADTPCPKRRQRSDLEDLHDALVMGIRDYFHKTEIFDRVVIGLSGGIDSAVTCTLAVEALGSDRVVGVTMPSRYSSPGSVDDSVALARNLGITLHEVSIRPAVDAFERMLSTLFTDTEDGVAEENIQARSRGVTLMAICNKFNYLLLTTGNKSELATGYATLYGDMSGGLAVLSDVLKTQVFALSRFINERAGTEVIPESTLTKPPSAELRPNQKDSDSLPPYDVLDVILQDYVEMGLDENQISRTRDIAPETVSHVVGMVDRNEYKRRQAAPGLRVTNKAFGLGRRLPVVMRWRPIRLENAIDSESENRLEPS